MSLVPPLYRPLKRPLYGALVRDSGMPWDGPATRAYDPTQESGRFLDFDADFGITPGTGGVASWVERAQSLSFAMATTAQRPDYEATGLNGKPCVHSVQATNDALSNASVPAIGTGLYEVTALVEDLGLVARNDLLRMEGDANPRTIVCLSSNTTQIGALQLSTIINVVNRTTAVQVLTWSFDTNLLTIYRNGVSIGSAAYVNQSIDAGTYYLFGLGSGGVDAQCRLRRLIVHTNVDAARRARVESYLKVDGGL